VSAQELPERFNMAWYFLDRNVEEGRGDKRCLYWRDQAFTYREVQAAANRLGNALRALGIGTEDRVLIVLPDRPEFAFTWFGAAKIGAVIAMVNPLLPAEEYLHYFEYTRAKVAIVESATLEKLDPLRERFTHLRHLLVVGEPGPHLLRRKLREGVRPIGQRRHAPRRPRHLALHERVDGQAQGGRAPAAGPALEHGAIRQAGDGHPPDDLTVSVPKLFFGYATGTNLLFPFAVGAATALFSASAARPRPSST
jgi:acyl-coenzyme A synthetase/AMP-(fatty) acid ligase